MGQTTESYNSFTQHQPLIFEKQSQRVRLGGRIQRLAKGTGWKFKALWLWFVIRAYGVANLQSRILSDIRLAKLFESLVRSDPRFKIITPRLFSLACFPFNPSGQGTVEGLNRTLLERVNSTGRVYMTHMIVGGIYTLRCAVGSTLTEEGHVVAAWKLIKEGADASTKE